jgi:lipid-A-disaccharide synthase
MRYYIIAGEKSGDLHGSNLVKSIVQEDSHATLRGIGGELMQEVGVGLFMHFKQINFFGFSEVLLNLLTIFKAIKHTKADILEFRPNVLILIDFAGFNMRMAEFAKEQGIKVFYYISPKIWAWNTGRAHKIKRLVDKMFVILPFEVEFYKQFDYEVDYVGNPIMDAITSFKANPQFLIENQLSDKPIIALLPGSRKGEVGALLSLMLQLKELFPACQLVVAAVSTLPSSMYAEAEARGIKVVTDQTYDLLSVAKSAVVASGTATLETGLFYVPQVVVYKISAFSYFIGKMLVQVRDIALVNLITDKIIVKTLLQKELTVEKLEVELEKTLNEPKRSIILQDYQKLSHEIGKPGASQKAGKLMVKYLREALPL